YKATYSVSNIAMQVGSFNEGIWQTLETQERGWACDHGEVYIVTGVIFGGPHAAVFHPRHHREMAIAIPTHFWKVIYTPDDGGHGVAFIFPNSTDPGSLAHAARTIKQLEQVAELNFLPQLTTADSARVESEALDVSFWKIDHPAHFSCAV